MNHYTSQHAGPAGRMIASAASAGAAALGVALGLSLVHLLAPDTLHTVLFWILFP